MTNEAHDLIRHKVSALYMYMEDGTKHSHSDSMMKALMNVPAACQDVCGF
jgi:hypothetical protein